MKTKISFAIGLIMLLPLILSAQPFGQLVKKFHVSQTNIGTITCNKNYLFLGKQSGDTIFIYNIHTGAYVGFKKINFNGWGFYCTNTRFFMGNDEYSLSSYNISNITNWSLVQTVSGLDRGWPRDWAEDTVMMAWNGHWAGTYQFFDISAGTLVAKCKVSVGGNPYSAARHQNQVYVVNAYSQDRRVDISNPGSCSATAWGSSKGERIWTTQAGYVIHSAWATTSGLWIQIRNQSGTLTGSLSGQQYFSKLVLPDGFMAISNPTANNTTLYDIYDGTFNHPVKTLFNSSVGSYTFNSTYIMRLVNDSCEVWSRFSPNIQTTNVTFFNTQANQCTFNWTDGNGSKRAVFIKQDSVGQAMPLFNTSYTANNVFGSGSQIGTSGWYCVFNGTTHTSGVTVTGLQSNTKYRVMVCEYNGVVGSEQYNINAANQNPAIHSTSCVSLLPVSISNTASANPICAGTSVTFTATPVNGGTSPVYQWKKGGTSISGATNVTYSYTPANGDVITCSLMSNATCISGNPATSNAITMQTKPVPIPSISGPANICLNAVGNIYSTNPGMTSYNWAVTGGTITNGGGSAYNSATVTWTTVGTQGIFVNYINGDGCTAASPTHFPVTVSNSFAPGTPGTIAGLANVTPGQSNVNYTIPVISGATGYVWQLPSGATITSGLNTNSITVNFSPTATTGMITVYGTNSCGNGAVSNGLLVYVGSTIPVVLYLYNLNLGINTNICYNATQNIQVAGNGSNFNVSSGGNVTLIAGKKIYFLPGTSLFNGSYVHGYITQTGNYCQNPGAPMVAVQTGEEETSINLELKLFKVYPNPTSGNFTMEISADPDQQPVKVQCYNITGSMVMEKVFYSGIKQQLTLENQSPGIYLLRVSQGSRTELQKIIKH